VAFIRSVGLVIITMLVTVFFIQNLASTEVVFITWSVSAPRAIVFFLVFVAGWIMGLLVNAIRPRRKPQTPIATPSPPRDNASGDPEG
jgi:uncharacterized integral membrane protein